MKKVFLIGFRGAGKTTLGNLLAKELGWDFLDFDQAWEKSNGSILNYVAQHGLEKFREKELGFLKTHLDQSIERNLIVATGGGIVETEEALRLLAETASEKIFLDPPVDQLWGRLSGDPSRLKIGDIKDFSDFQRLWQKRRPKYQQIATLTLDNQDITQALRWMAKQLAH